MQRIITLTALMGLCAMVMNGPAFAHATLEQAVPAVGSTVTAAPKEIRLKYSEGVEAALCKVTVTGSKGAVKTARPHAAAGDNTTLVIDLPGSLGAGTYKVEWRAVSVDTHRSEGSFSFTIQP